MSLDRAMLASKLVRLWTLTLFIVIALRIHDWRIGLVICPDDLAGREIELHYEDLAQRITRITDSESGLDALAEYLYTGLTRRVGQTYGRDDAANAHAAQWLAWDATGSNSPPNYDKLDRFGRTKNLLYADKQDDTVQQRQYGYDLSDNRLYELVTRVDSQGIEIVNEHSGLFAYDGLNRLISGKLGTLNGTNDGLTVQLNAHDWALDSLGNWQEHDITDEQSVVTQDDHATNERNEIESIDDGTNVTDFVYDKSGNLISDGSLLFNYDGWGRLVEVSELGDLVLDDDGGWISGASGQWLVHYTYDALGRLVRQQRPAPSTNGDDPSEVRTERYFYDGVRRIQEILTEPIPIPSGPGGGGPSMGGEIAYDLADPAADREYVYSPDYVDEIVCQFDVTGTPLFVLQDSNYNAIAIVSETGSVLSQYTYGPYGDLLYADNFANHAFNTIGHQGLFATNLAVESNQAQMAAGQRLIYHNRNRTYEPQLGRFLQADPNGTASQVLGLEMLGLAGSPILQTISHSEIYHDGLSRHAAVGSSPLVNRDPTGLIFGLGGLGMANSIGADLNAQEGEMGARTMNSLLMLSQGIAAQQVLTLVIADAVLSSAGGKILDQALKGINTVRRGLTGIAANRASSEVAEQAVRNMFGGRRASLAVPGYGTRNRRVIDSFSGGVAREIKVGRTNLSSRVRQQIDKDVALRDTAGTDVKSVEWWFFPGKTGTGPSSNLKGYLQKHDIKIRIIEQ